MANDFWFFAGLTMLVPSFLWLIGAILGYVVSLRRDAERESQRTEQRSSMVTLYRRRPYDWMEPELDAGQVVEEAERILAEARHA